MIFNKLEFIDAEAFVLTQKKQKFIPIAIGIVGLLFIELFSF